MTAAVDRVDTAYRALRQAIIEQALLPGTKLPEDELGRHFGMSRTLVRTVLTRLQAQGLVDTFHKRTATVAQPSLQEAKEAFAVRRALEREAAGLVVARWDASIDAVLTAHVADEAAAAAAGNTRVSPPASPVNSICALPSFLATRCSSAICPNSSRAAR